MAAFWNALPTVLYSIPLRPPPSPPHLTYPSTYLPKQSRAAVRPSIHLAARADCRGREQYYLARAGDGRTAADGRADAVSWNAVDSREQRNERMSEKGEGRTD